MTLFYNDNIQLNTDKAWITTIDSHTEGEATRLIVKGIGDIAGSDMNEKLNTFKTRYDHIRCFLTREPRGSRDILAAAVTRNVTPRAAFGLIYMDAKRYPYLCGHATIGAVVTLAKTGFLKLKNGDNRVGVDTPSGLMEAQVVVENEQVVSVAIHMVPSFVYKTGQIVDVAGFGKVSVDLVCTGGFFAMVDAAKLGISAELKNKERLIALGMDIIDAANEQLQVSHPERPDVNTVDVTEFYETCHDTDKAWGKGLVVYGESHADRSPCGTGTAAKLALLCHNGQIKMHQPYTNYSPLGTSFEAQLVERQKIGSFDGYVSRIEGMAYITGIHQFMVESHDPFQKGYII